MQPVLTNATLTKIAPKAASENFLTAETDAPPRWQGSSPCWVTEVEQTTAGQQGETQRRRDTLVVDAELAPVTPEDVVVFVFGGQQQTRRVQSVNEDRLDGTPVTYTLALFDAD